MITAINPVYNSYNRVSFGIMKPKRKTAMPDNYNNKDKDFDYNKASRDLTQKFARYPISIKGIVLLIPEYLTGKTDSKTFAKNCQDRTPVLLTRIGMGKDGQEFQHIYQREISLIKSLNDSCYRYSIGDMKKDDFDTFVELHTKNLINTQSPFAHKF